MTHKGNIRGLIEETHQTNEKLDQIIGLLTLIYDKLPGKPEKEATIDE